jgi:hypothetical protein
LPNKILTVCSWAAMVVNASPERIRDPFRRGYLVPNIGASNITVDPWYVERTL